jgi:NAD(P)-dependent dehydrogenase (short-subunit alcohol dehydrogenase family)
VGQALAGRVAIVTGGSRGIGKGCALELAAAGATVYLTGRTVREGDAALPGTVGATAAEIAAHGGNAIAVACDHRDDAAVEALFARVDREQGRLDVLVNNAFLIPPELTAGKKFFETPISNWDDMIDVGTRSAYVASAFAARRMAKAAASFAQRAEGERSPSCRGLIANISSSGAAKYAWHVAYGVGKAALDRLTADTAHELRDLGVAVVSLWPGFVRTERVEKYASQLSELAHVKSESQRFTGRAVVALAADPDVVRLTGRALASRDLADQYGFTDVDGSLPDGPLQERPYPRLR